MAIEKLYSMHADNLDHAAVLIEKTLNINLMHRDNAIFDEYYYADLGDNREIILINNRDMDDYTIHGEGYMEEEFKEHGILIYVRHAESCQKIIAKLNAHSMRFLHLRTKMS